MQPIIIDGDLLCLEVCPQGMLLALVLPIIEQCHCLTFNLGLYLIWASSTSVAVVGLCLVLINLSVQYYYYLFPISRLPVSWKLLADHEMDTTGLTGYFIKTMPPPGCPTPDQTVYYGLPELPFRQEEILFEFCGAQTWLRPAALLPWRRSDNWKIRKD